MKTRIQNQAYAAHRRADYGLVALVLVSLMAPQMALTATRYVNLNNAAPAAPYTNWATAATNIQDAVDAATDGDEIVVTNGVYVTGGRVMYGETNRVVVDKAIVVRSVNGPEVTTIRGNRAESESVRCVYLTHGGVLIGFTLTNGMSNDSGGGVLCTSGNLITGSSTVVSNCFIIGNSARFGGGAAGGLLFNCRLAHNSAIDDGGGAYVCTLTNSILTENVAGEAAGGAYRCVMTDCTISGNSSLEGGGGVMHSTLFNCTLSGNSTEANGGGGASNSRLNNCLLLKNSANGGGGASASILNNCTATGNSAGYTGGTAACTLTNCIVYGNSATNNRPNYSFGFMTFITFTCTTPLPEGVGNITNEPAFVNPAAGNYRLRPDSPCIDAGTNLSAIISNDLDGRPRPLDGNGDGIAAFDMGAYEHRTPLLVWQDSPNPTPPHADWATAAHTIQDAVDAALAGDTVLVTNGVYATGGRAVDGSNTNRVTADKPVTVRSVNGPAETIIQGFTPFSMYDPGVRCAYLTNGAALIGFTLTNGKSINYGGGVFCEDASAVVSNCVLVRNAAGREDGGASQGGGARGGTLINCVFTNNLAALGAAAYGSTLQACLVTDSLAAIGALDSCTADRCVIANTRTYGNGEGTGAFRSTLNECLLVGNYGVYGGGASHCTLSHCVLSNNLAWSGGGAWYSTLDHCLLINNEAGEGGGIFGCIVNNSTLTGNRAAEYGGGAWAGVLSNCTLTWNSSELVGGGVYQARLVNCIIYHNNAPAGANYLGSEFHPVVLNYSCTTPLPTNGLGNITHEPEFVDLAGGNLRLQSNSPCINAGRNASAPGDTDLDGLPRIAGGTVDMGTYEFQSPASTLSFAWLLQHGLPLDGSADHADSDGDLFSNFGEWRAGTNPTNALSLLRLLPPIPTGPDVAVTWESVPGRTYFLERSADLGAIPRFLPLAANLPAQSNTNVTTFTHTNAVGGEPHFYRVGVQP